TRLGPALRDRMATEHPDLEHLAAGALRQGRTQRRRRTIGVTVGGVALVTAAGLGATALAGGATPDAVDETPVASGPEDAPTTELTVGQVLDLGEGLSATIAADDNGLYRLGASTSPG